MSDILEPIRKYLNKGNNAADVGITISSGMRCPELNTLIKGSEKSQHMYCEAADMVKSKNDCDILSSRLNSSL